MLSSPQRRRGRGGFAEKRREKSLLASSLRSLCVLRVSAVKEFE
jgi:hypothetical protein